MSRSLGKRMTVESWNNGKVMKVKSVIHWLHPTKGWKVDKRTNFQGRPKTGSPIGYRKHQEWFPA